MSVPRTIRVLIADDEALARQRLEDLLRKEAGVEIVGAVDNGQHAVEAIQTLRPDLVFLDVQMSGRTGLEVVREVGPENMPPTIFVTAYDRYAIEAFDVAALDYLVKPFDDERFEQAFRRARRLIELQEVGRLTEQLRGLLQGERRGEARGETRVAATAGTSGGEPTAAAGAGGGAAPPRAAYLERIAVEMRGQVRVVPVETIEYITASGPYAEIHVGDKTYIIRERMQTLEERLDPSRFFRIHRSVIVRLERIDTLLREPGGDYAVQLKSGARLSVSRNRVEPLEQWMGLPR
ncbi:MAG TPA: LytTR family DNA-binding domain-containing protein [Steroidobacteraceae bacterium]|nr:LytTR family DNA-binding domain-containing protein [Steroidobacteraceae bacterium]